MSVPPALLYYFTRTEKFRSPWHEWCQKTSELAYQAGCRNVLVFGLIKKIDLKHTCWWDNDCARCGAGFNGVELSPQKLLCIQCCCSLSAQYIDDFCYVPFRCSDSFPSLSSFAWKSVMYAAVLQGSLVCFVRIWLGWSVLRLSIFDTFLVYSRKYL